MASTRIRTAPHAMRKAPRQARSRATVDALVEAATQVLGRQGWAGFNTNEVAQRAGVSIGSLYQYFPNKLALIEAIRRRHFDSVLAVLDQACRAPAGSGVECLVEGMLRVHGAHPALHKALLEEAPHGPETASERQFRARYLRGYKAFVAKQAQGGGRPGGALTARVVAAAVEGVVHHAAVNGLAARGIARETARLLRGYLTPG